MSNRYNNGSHYQNHERAAELHEQAAHAHRAAAVQRGKQDHQTGHEQSRQALEHSERAFLHSQELRHEAAGDHDKPTAGTEEIAALAHELWVGRGCPEGSADQDWLLAEKQLGAKER